MVPPGATRAPQSRRSARAIRYRCAPSTNKTSTPPSTSSSASPENILRCGAVADAGVGEVGDETRMVVGGGVLETLDLLRATIVPGMGIDRDHLHRRRSREREDDGRPTAEAPDLHDPPVRPARPRRAEQRLGLGTAEPTVDRLGDRPGVPEQTSCVHRHTEHDPPRRGRGSAGPDRARTPSSGAAPSPRSSANP